MDVFPSYSRLELPLYTSYFSTYSCTIFHFVTFYGTFFYARIHKQIILQLYCCTENFISEWSLGQFGVNVMAFGLYQMSADIDSRTGHIVWWLILDIVWMYLYWEGVTAVLGDWNPWTGS